ncbi:MAG: phosphatidylserine decarboxylase [Anaerolineales bacterium]|jgi:phosphatidylserine decarboxylase|nr:MAG: phosphatidylserine decarboxylase [Anaerolineales bacterium]
MADKKDAPRSSMTIAKEARREFTLVSLLTLSALFAALILRQAFWVSLATLLGIIWVGLALFFRDPARAIPREDGYYYAPADGKVVVVERVNEPIFMQCEALRIAIFMSIADVHVNRTPGKGVVIFTRHVPGKFIQAFRPEAALENEHNLIGMGHGGDRILIKQIAGILARRIVCSVQLDDELEAGDRIGMIKFGSRVELYLPTDCQALIQTGDIVRAGITPVARYRDVD